MNYTWHIYKLGLKDQINNDGQLLEDAIVSVKWKKIATDTDGTRSSYVSETELSAAAVSVSDFVSLSSVTKEMVVGWIQSAINPTDMAKIDSILASKIERARVRVYNPGWN